MQKEEFYNLLNKPETLNENEVEKLRELTEKHPYFQWAQILYLKYLKDTSNPEFNHILKKVAVLVPDRKQLYRFLNDEKINPFITRFDYKNETAPSFNLEYDTEIVKGDSLIDKFLSSNSGNISIPRPEKEQLQETDNEILKNSTTENDEIVTETLAMIYFQQKKYDKALDAFHKLSLKYPEKSVYFATRIEEIEKLKNI